MIRKHQRFFKIMFICLDTLTLSAAYLVSYLIKCETDPSFRPNTDYFNMLMWMLPLFILVFFFMDVYSPMRSKMYRKEALLLIKAVSVGVVALFSTVFAIKLSHLSREIFFTFAILGLLLLLLQRFVVRRTLRHLRKKGYNQKHMLMVGAGAIGRDFALKVRAHRDFGYNVVGFLDDDVSKQGTEVLGRPVLGHIGSISEVIRQGIDEVIVALPLLAYEKYEHIIDACEKEGVRVRIIFDYHGKLPGYPKIEDFDGIPLLNARYLPLDDPLNRYLKRFLDVAVALTAIILASPIMVLAALCIKLSSPGPVFFMQERVGLNNKIFRMLKFRSMSQADDQTAATRWTTADDPRKTKVGNFLRKTSLDELPQFFNVLKGDMSVVGPRPERPFFVEQFKEEISKYMVKHQVKPGITGWAQVNGWRGDTSIKKRIECDIYYMENWDLLFDIKIMFLTIFKGLVNKNAY